VHCPATAEPPYPFLISVINQLDAQNFCFTISLFHVYMFRAHVLIIRRSKLHYTASSIITLKQVSESCYIRQSSYCVQQSHGLTAVLKPYLKERRGGRGGLHVCAHALPVAENLEFRIPFGLPNFVILCSF